MSVTDLLGKLNGVVSQGQSYLDTAQAVGQLFGLDIADSLGINRGFNPELQGVSFNNFRSNIDSVGLVRPIYFLCDIPTPKGLKISAGGNGVLGTLKSIANDVINTNAKLDDVRTRTLLTEAIALPGMAFLTSDNIRRYGYGQIDTRPYGVNITDVNLSFLVDAKSNIHNFFYRWMNYIIPSAITVNDSYSDERKGFYKAAYKKEYVVPISLTIYNEKFNQILVCTFRDAYPHNIDPIQMNWGSVDEVARMNVGFRYTDFSIKHIGLPSDLVSRGSPDGTGLSFLQKLQSGVNVVQTLSSLTKPRSIGDVINIVGNLESVF